jgi:DNA-binding transcriptional ArsR family regulator
MSPASPSRRPPRHPRSTPTTVPQFAAVAAPVFAALGDETRLALVARLADGGARSISQLTDGSKVTRQAITRHLRILERAGIVRCTRAGRERRFGFEPRRLQEMKRYLDGVSRQWDDALLRLKAFAED